MMQLLHWPLSALFVSITALVLAYSGIAQESGDIHIQQEKGIISGGPTNIGGSVDMRTGLDEEQTGQLVGQKLKEQLAPLIELLQNVKGPEIHGVIQKISGPESVRLAQKFQQLSGYVNGAAILWVDDQNPQQNASLRHVLATYGAIVDLARSTDEALKWIAQANYDVIITDLHRQDDEAEPCYRSPTPANAGCALLKYIGSEFTDPTRPPAIVYAGNIYPELGTPPYATGMTDRPDELFDLILNALKDRRGKDRHAVR